MKRDQIGLQLYTVRELTAKDFVGTLRRLGEMGYPAVQFAGYGDVPVATLRSALDEAGMRCLGAHIRYDAFDTRLDEALAELKTLGGEHAVVPFLAPELRGDADQVRRVAEAFNRWAERCKAEGLRFGYHNHGFEFERVGDLTMLELLIAETDPSLVGFELDIYWAQYAGSDPVELIRRHADRIRLLHVKDMVGDGEPRDAPVGEGTLPWDRILAAAREASVEWYIVEQDTPQDAMRDVEISLRNLERMATPSA